MASSVAPVTPHQTTGTIINTHRPRPRASNSSPSVATAVGSGATPKISTLFHPRPSSTTAERLDQKREEEDPQARTSGKIGRPLKPQRPANGPDPDQEHGFEAEGPGEIGRGPVDRRVPVRLEGDRDPEPARRQGRREDTASRRSATRQQPGS